MSMVEGAKLVAIYGLHDPRTDALRYVGKTTNPHRRFTQHCRGHIAQLHMPVVRWCRDLKAIGLKPKMEVLTWCSDWEPIERRMIAAYRKAGVDLLNVADGGAHVPRSKSGNTSAPRYPTAGLFRVAMSEMGRWQGILERDGSPVASNLEAMAHDYRRTRVILTREATPKAVARFDINLWAQYVYKKPLEFHMNTMARVEDTSDAYRLPIVAAAVKALRRYGVLIPSGVFPQWPRLP